MGTLRFRITKLVQFQYQRWLFHNFLNCSILTFNIQGGATFGSHLEIPVATSLYHNLD